MEGLIPFVYRAIIQYRNGGKSPAGNSWFGDSPSASYMRLPDDSGRFRSSEMQFFSSPAPSAPATKGIQSPLRRSTSRRLA